MPPIIMTFNNYLESLSDEEWSDEQVAMLYLFWEYIVLT